VYALTSVQLLVGDVGSAFAASGILGAGLGVGVDTGSGKIESALAMEVANRKNISPMLVDPIIITSCFTWRP
jgi:hypothetical protein